MNGPSSGAGDSPAGRPADRELEELRSELGRELSELAKRIQTIEERLSLIAAAAEAPIDRRKPKRGARKRARLAARAGIELPGVGDAKAGEDPTPKKRAARSGAKTARTKPGSGRGAKPKSAGQKAKAPSRTKAGKKSSVKKPASKAKRS